MTTLVGAAVLLVVAGSSWAAARAALAWCGEGSRSIAAALAVAYVAVVPGQIARAVVDLRVGCAVAAVLALGVAVALRKVPRPSAADRPPPWWALTVFVVLFAVVAATCVRGNFYDEPAHWPMILEIARGVVPPHVTSLPAVVHAYHWGFDALAATLVNAGLTVEQAEDAAACGTFALLLSVLWTVGARTTKTGAFLVAAGVPLSGSVLAAPLWFPSLLSPGALPSSWTEPMRIPQVTILAFFQHPQGLAMPLFVAVLLVFVPLVRQPHKNARVVGGVLLALVSLCNVVYFEALGLALGVVALVRFGQSRAWSALFLDGAALVAALVAAVLFGGILGHAPPLEAGSFFGDGFLLNAVHTVVVFGVPLVAVPFLALRSPPWSVALAAVAAVLFVVPAFVVLADTWDIVKLYDVAAFAAGLLFFSALAAAFGRGRRALAIVAGLATIAVPAAVLARTAIDPPVEMELDPRVEVWRRAFTGSIPPTARVLTEDPALNARTGFFTPGFLLVASTFDPYAYLHADKSAALADAEVWTHAIRDLRRADLDKLAVDYVIASAGLERGLSAEGKAALADETRFKPVVNTDDAVLLEVVR